jgi:hypothetical protein
MSTSARARSLNYLPPEYAADGFHAFDMTMPGESGFRYSKDRGSEYS